MSSDTLRAEMSDIFLTEMVVYPDIYVHFENQPLKHPATAWFHFGIVANDGMRATIGTTRIFNKQKEFVVIELYVPENTGTKDINTYMDFVAGIFQDRSFILSDGDTVSFKTAKKRVNGNRNGFYMRTVTIPLVRRECVNHG